ncbi:hypothetical protein [Roseateles sp.]|uniref:hypothetical protein n=1 Tax=Roseateles sp. TaxID=1971397 RepID=UPI0031D91BB1
MPNRIYRGHVERQPRSVSDKTVAGAYLPGTFVVEGASSLTQATAFGPNLLLLADRDYYSLGALDSTDPLKVAYASGDTGLAYEINPNDRFQAAVAAATYTYGQELTVGAAGRLVAAATGNVVVAVAKSAGAKAAGDLIDVTIVNFYTKP